jgi:hypothetical protein
MPKKRAALISPESQAILQRVLSGSLVTHHFGECPEFRRLFAEHLKTCPLHQQELDGLKARAREWAGELRQRLFGF